MSEELTWTKEEVLERVEYYKQFARDTFLRDGNHITISFLFTTKNLETGEDGKSMEMVPLLGGFTSEESKDAYSQLIRFMAHALNGVGIIFISEAWLLKTMAQEGLTIEQASRKYAGKVHEHPDRVEVLWVICEHVRFGTLTWMAEILRPNGPDQPAGLGPWQGSEQFRNDSGGPLKGPPQHRGRFMHLLPAMD